MSSLLQQLKNNVQHYKNKEKLQGVRNEHSIFVPVVLIRGNAKETEEFIKLARHIKDTPEYRCPVVAETTMVRGISGLEFVFVFEGNTDFDAIIEEIDRRL